MRAYIAVTGTIFLLIVGAHLWRATVETALARDPVYIALTVTAALLAGWALRLLLSHRR
jgi:hypothetical protein